MGTAISYLKRSSAESWAIGIAVGLSLVLPFYIEYLPGHNMTYLLSLTIAASWIVMIALSVALDQKKIDD